MNKFLFWFYKFYPLDNTSLKRKILMHLCFWLIYGITIGLGVISNSSVSYMFLVGCYSVVEAALAYYGVVYLIFPYISEVKTFIWGIFFIFLLVYIHFFAEYLFYKIAIVNEFINAQSYTYIYGKKYLENGLYLGIFKDKNIFYELSFIYNSTSFPFLFKFIRIIGNYFTNLQKVNKEKTDFEIQFLRSQLNPHFLFNSLNSIYSQVVNKNDTAGNSIVLLSNLLKHIVYNSNHTFIPLKNEINFIKDYIDLEKMKSFQAIKIQYSQEGDSEGYLIAPLILSNYVENAFKHVSVIENHIPFIAINIKIENNKLYFIVENDSTTSQRTHTTKKSGGLGMLNTQKRLHVLYPQKHVLNVITSDKTFKVELQLDLK